MEDNLAAIAFLIIFIIFAILSMQYGDRARLVPLPVAIGSGVLVLIQLVLQNSREASNLRLAVNAGELFGTEKIKESFEGKKIKDKTAGGKEGWAFLMLALFLVTILVVGIEAATIIFVAGYFRFINKAGWMRSLLWGAGTMMALYILFTILLRINFYRGLLEQLI
ncbi:hypothetical protein MHOCP_22210 [Moorella humiferrea]|uniref:tripartite tricarboxylate transporter TctB family protein n=1 Tax=Neomoorella humiferrea TaxID=676965 RepID=UPI0030CCC67C